MAVNSMLFRDNDGLLCAIRKDGNTFDEAHEIACEKLCCENVKQCHDYTHMYFGFGTSDGETDNTWWLVDNSSKHGIPVYVFRENLD
jgi:hypothetical protein